MSRARDTADQINRVNSSAADATAITVTSSENVGVGLSTNIASKLHVNSELSLGQDNNNRMIVGSTSGGIGSIGTIEGGTTSFSSMTFKGGNVGIGDSNPLSILHVGTGSNANVPITLAPSTGGNIEFRNTSSTGTFTISNANGSSEKIRIDNDGLKFNGDTAAANALGDYEEGTFTVGFEGATVSAANTTATYTKIGDLVTWYWYSSSTSISSSSASGKITGLPFTVLVTNNNYNPVSISHNTYFGGSTSVGAQGYHLVGNNKVVFNTIGQANNPSFVNGNGISIMVHGSYKTAS